MASVNLNIYTSRPRHDVIAQVKDAIAGAGGWIASHAIYSNKAATIRAAIERQHLAGFAARLVGNELIDKDAAETRALVSLDREGDGSEVIVACAMTFLHDEPDLRQTVPAVPG